MPSSTIEMDVQHRAQSALQASPIQALRECRAQASGETLLLLGRVTTFYHKQLAQEVVRAVSDGVEVVNEIRVH